ncbi:MAG: DNA-binding response regulator [Verrucomicrobia bacterium]|nr:MAG: DNA-binding response regulator [Verrucomicrobiota bacterium]
MSLPVIRVSIVEDDEAYCSILRQHLDQTEDIRCISCYHDPQQAINNLPTDQPDVVLMDLNLPGKSGIECIAELLIRMTALQAIMLTVFEQDEQVFAALEAGACGYLVKRNSLSRIADAIREAHEGGSPMSANIARMVVASFRRDPSQQPLSPQESEVLARLAHGDTYAAIAAEMNIAVHTVRNYIRRIYTKLHVHSRTEAVAKFMSQKHH